MPDLITSADVGAAAERIRGACVRTPLVPLIGADPAVEPLWLKPESLQPTGAFKLRGATNAVQSLGADALRAGVVTHSSGNHGQALACAARTAGIPCTVVVPEGAPQVKIDGMTRWGAEIVEVPAPERVPTCEQIAQETGAVVVPPFDDPRIIAGQGTVGLEVVADLAGVRTVLVPVGGGGLISGVATAVKAFDPTIAVVGVEPEISGDAAESFREGRLVSWTEEQTNRTIADGLRVPSLGALTWAHISALVDDVVTVTEEQIAAGVRTIAHGARLVAEPSGAVATAGYLAHEFEAPVVAVLSGGNVDPARFGELLG